MKTETRLHKLAQNAPNAETFISEIQRFAAWFLTDEQKRYTKRDLRIFYDAIHGGKYQ